MPEYYNPPAPPRTAGIRDTVYNILDALEEKGLATWGVLSDEDADALRAEARDIILDALGVTTEPAA